MGKSKSSFQRKIFLDCLTYRLILFAVQVEQDNLCIQKCKLLYQYKHGFRKKQFISNGLARLVKHFHMKIDLKFYICSIFIDLRKAFDAVSRDVLLNKWNYHGDRANR